MKWGGLPYDSVFEIYIDKLSAADLKNEKNTALIYQFTNTLQSPGSPQLMRNKAYFITKNGQKGFDKKIVGIAEAATKEGVVKKEESLIKGATKLLKDAKVKTLKCSVVKRLQNIILEYKIGNRTINMLRQR